MARVDRWRRWHPTAKKFDGADKEALTKLTERGFDSFVSSNSACTPNFSLISDGSDAAAWAENFHRWMLERCTFQIRSFGGVESLYQDFYDWSKAHDELPAPCLTFDELLTAAGLFQANGLVSGLILRADHDATRPTNQLRSGNMKRRKDLLDADAEPSQWQSRRRKRNDSR